MTLIDMCGALENETGTANRSTLEGWYRANLADRYTWLKPEDCYGLRCGLVHQGIAKTDAKGHASQWARIFFVLMPNGNTFRNSAATDAYLTGLPEFCLDVCSQVKVWAASKQTDAIVQRNMKNLMKFYREGLSPYVVGVPLLG